MSEELKEAQALIRKPQRVIQELLSYVLLIHRDTYSGISLAFANLTILSNLCKMVYNVTHGVTDASDKVSKVILYAPWENYFTH